MDDRYAVVDGDEVVEIAPDADEAAEERDRLGSQDGFEPSVYRVSFHEAAFGDGGSDEGAVAAQFPLESPPDDSLVNVVESLPQADPDTLEQSAEGEGHFVMECDEGEVDDEAVLTALEDAGYTRRDVFAVPNRVKQKFEPL